MVRTHQAARQTGKPTTVLKFAEDIVGQELHSLSYTELFGYLYWVREKSQSSAKVDYLVPVDGRIIPVEVKSGAVGRLRLLIPWKAFMRHWEKARVKESV